MSGVFGTTFRACLLACAACSPNPPKVSVPYGQDFSAPELPPEFEARGGGWQVRDGALFNDGAHNVPLWLSAALPRDVRVSFTARSESDAVDIKCEIFGDGVDHESGYVVIFSGWNNTRSIIARRDEHAPERSANATASLMKAVTHDPEAARREHAHRRDVVARPHRGTPRELYRFTIERRGHNLDLYVNDTLHLRYFDPSPLFGAGQDRFAFNNWASKVTFDDLSIEPL